MHAGFKLRLFALLICVDCARWLWTGVDRWIVLGVDQWSTPWGVGAFNQGIVLGRSDRKV